MSLYGYLSLNPSIIPLVKSFEKTPRHHVVASFQTKCIVHRRYGQYIPMNIFHLYIPTVSPTELVRWYIPIDFEMKFSLSVITTDEIFTSVIPLVFSSFLVVWPNSVDIYQQNYGRNVENIKKGGLLTWRLLRVFFTNGIT